MDGQIYLDHAATTPPCPEAIEASMAALTSAWGNPSSVHAKGQEARAVLDAARDAVASYFGCLPRNIVFTSSGTEADVLALHGILGRWGGERGRHLVISAIEHEAVLATAHALHEQDRCSLTVVEPNDEGVVTPETVCHAVQPDTVLVSIMAANNETGVIQPVASIADAVRESNPTAFVHTDAVQAAGTLPCTLDELHVDALSVSSHKLYGPKGAGCLILRDGVFVAPHMTGGGQERNRRSGTENLPAIAGFGAAVRALQESRDAERERLMPLRDGLISQVRAGIPDVVIPGEHAERLASCAAFLFPGIRNEQLLARLDAAGLCVSGGSACAAGAATPSHVLTSMGYDEALSKALIRCSLGHSTTEHDIAVAARTLVTCVQAMRSAP